MSYTSSYLIDTHCHLDIQAYAEDLPALLRRAGQNGVKDFIIPGYIATGWQRMIELAERYACLHPAPGLHPLYLTHHSESALARLETILSNKQVVAVGEIGIDLLHQTGNESLQRTLFEQQLRLAAQYNLPVILHVRKAHDQVISVIRRTGFNNGGIVHAFNGSLQQAEKYLEAGFKLGYGGTLTYSRANRIRTLAAKLPLSAIVLETDSPDIPLFDRRQQPNSPEFLPEIVDALSQLRSENREEIAAATTLNALNAIPLIRKADDA